MVSPNKAVDSAGHCRFTFRTLLFLAVPEPLAKHWISRGMYAAPGRRSCRLLLRCGKQNDLPALFGRNPFSALFPEFLRYVVINHDCHCSYHTSRNSLRSIVPPHQFASPAIHCPLGFTRIPDIPESAVKAIAVYESIGFMHVSACTKALQRQDR